MDRVSIIRTGLDAHDPGGDFVNRRSTVPHHTIITLAIRLPCFAVVQNWISIRSLAAETERESLAQLAAIIPDESNHEALPSAVKQALQAIVDQLAALKLQVGNLDRAIHAHHGAKDMSCRLETVLGIGVMGATAIASTVTDPSSFKFGRDFAAWVGLVPRQHSTSDKVRLGGRHAQI